MASFLPGKEVRLVEAWWNDVKKGSISRPHPVGKIVFTRERSDGSPPLICIDGQQRCTTSLLLLASLRDGCLSLLLAHPAHPAGLKLLQGLNNILYTNPVEAESWIASSDAHDFATLGAGRSFSRLIPSLADRANYFEAVLSGLLPEQSDKSAECRHEYLASHQGQAKLTFDGLVSEALKRHSQVDSGFDFLDRTADGALRGMGLMYVEILNEIELGQVFQWMQEKSLFGSGAMCFNGQPGLTFNGACVCGSHS